jgi:hypothetical protein
MTNRNEKSWILRMKIPLQIEIGEEQKTEVTGDIMSRYH